MRNRPYSMSGGHASVRSSNHHDMVNRRHSAAPSRGPTPRQRTYSAYRPPSRQQQPQVVYAPSQTPVAPRPLRPEQTAPPDWIHDNFDSDPVQGEQQTYYESYDRHDPSPVLEEPSSVPSPRRPKSPQSFGQILKSAPPRQDAQFLGAAFLWKPRRAGCQRRLSWPRLGG
ncbi:hypothetical protein PG996_015554 [Apiospora saccharicola]|uniref:Uncharacterized protein n=1 Tax=Apiospora saccharicola TaxID=335842 RepID=A0ABR1TLG1_9PEZI